MLDTDRTNQTFDGYIALPERGQGPGVLVLHAWWGLNSFFRALCDRLATEGFVAVAPDLYAGKTAATIEEAEALLNNRDSQAMEQRALAAIDLLQQHPAVQGDSIGIIGFSMGASWAMHLVGVRPEAIKAVVVFYGTGGGDFTASQAAFLGHYAVNDPWEPDNDVRQLEESIRAAGREVVFHHYEDTGHWFFENNRPDAYNETAATLAWERTLTFLRQQLG